MKSRDHKEFIFFDESGDPGPAGDPIYIVAAIHMAEPTLNHVRLHDAAFRYHSGITKEYKGQSWAPGIGQAAFRLLQPLADLTDSGVVMATVNWLRKSTYASNGGPHLGPGQTSTFRHFQIRLLLERHHGRRRWSNRTDLVVDRWDPAPDSRRNLEDYLRGNYQLRPQLEAVTFVDSLYTDAIQVADLYTRLARLIVNGAATTEHRALADRLFDMSEVTRGLY